MKTMTFGTMVEQGEFNTAFSTACPKHVFRFGNCPRVGDAELNASELRDELYTAIEEFEGGDEDAGDWASCVMSVLGFEWV